jgi:hypothetical protein
MCVFSIFSREMSINNARKRGHNKSLYLELFPKTEVLGKPLMEKIWDSKCIVPADRSG